MGIQDFITQARSHSDTSDPRLLSAFPTRRRPVSLAGFEDLQKSFEAKKK